jgi:hypothetical protein
VAETNHTAMESWRVIVGRRNGSDVFVLADRDTFSLPEVLVPRSERTAWHLNQQITHKCGLRVVSILPLEIEPATANYHVAEMISPETPLPGGASWADLASLARDAFQDRKDFDAVTDGLKSASRPATELGPFSSFGWFENLAKWVEDTTVSHGLSWNGNFEQFHAAASFSLIRFEASPHAIWFKAVGEPNTREYQITQTLAERQPGFVPRVLAVRPEWNGWLAEECPGKTLDAISDVTLWHQAARALAQLQIESVPHRDALLCAGAHPLPSVLSDTAIERFLRVSRELFLERPSYEALGICVDDLIAIAARGRQVLNLLGALDIPEAVGHLDLNAGNVIVAPGHCAFLDWAEAYIGFPFLTFEYLLQAFRRKIGRDSPDESGVAEAYLSAWEHSLSRTVVREAWTLTPFLALLAYTLRSITASESYLLRTPALANYVRSLVRKLKRALGTHGTLSARAAR